jgi:Gti1/Pac2 family transcription factor
MNSASALEPTYYGFIGSTYDALILFEACITGQINHVSRRPHDIERDRVIQSGSIFVYEENTSGIKRWTDGISWSPSRILGNFLIYRQLAKAFGPGEKKKAIKKTKTGPRGITKKNSEISSQKKENIFQAVKNLQPSGSTYSSIRKMKLETERALIGSLTDSYDFLQDGLVKKTISIHYGNVTHHLVSYYRISDAISQTFIVPSKDPRLAGTHPRVALISSQNFRNAIGDIDPLDLPTYPRSRHRVSQQSFLQRPSPIALSLDGSSSDSGTTEKLYNSDSNITIPSIASEHGLLAHASITGSTNQHITVLGGYPAPEIPENHQREYKQNLVMASSFKSDSNYAAILTAENMQRRLPLFHQRDSEDSGISMPMDRVMNGSTFVRKQNSMYAVSRDIIFTNKPFPVQTTLPISSQTDFTCQAVYGGPHPNWQKLSYDTSLNNTDAWQAGNVSAGHGHYQSV